MLDTLNAIAKRYSCRSFTDKVISDEDLLSIAKAAVQAPSGMNRQGWHISIVKNKELIDEIESEGLLMMKEFHDKSAYQRIMDRGGKLFYNATAIAFIAIAIPPTDVYPDNIYEKVDMGILAQNISLAATSLGIANCHCGLISFCFMSSKAADFRTKLKLPHGYGCNYGVLLGYAKDVSLPHNPNINKVSFIL
jgi:nitroreductase